jgi:Right handed beta helix region
MNWEVAYCTVDGGTTMTGGIQGHWRHHNIVKNIAGEGSLPSFLQVGGIVEDNEIGPSPGGAGNKFVGTKDMQVRHNRFIGQGTTGVPFLQGAGIWFDYNNQDFLFEWNICEDNNGAGIALEANHWDPDLGAPGVYTNNIRHNLFRNNGDAGVLIASSAFTEVYENVFWTNRIYAGTGEILMSLLKASQDPEPEGQGSDLKENHIHHNYFTPRSRGASFGVQDDVANYADYITNAKDNTWDFNVYDFVNPAAANLFRRELSDMTWAQWQAGGVPATAGAQDVNSSAI